MITEYVTCVKFMEWYEDISIVHSMELKHKVHSKNPKDKDMHCEINCDMIQAASQRWLQ